jgi:hypothetical protein
LDIVSDGKFIFIKQFRKVGMGMIVQMMSDFDRIFKTNYILSVLQGLLRQVDLNFHFVVLPDRNLEKTNRFLFSIWQQLF